MSTPGTSRDAVHTCDELCRGVVVMVTGEVMDDEGWNVRARPVTAASDGRWHTNVNHTRHVHKPDLGKHLTLITVYPLRTHPP